MGCLHQMPASRSRSARGSVSLMGVSVQQRSQVPLLNVVLVSHFSYLLPFFTSWMYLMREVFRWVSGHRVLSSRSSSANSFAHVARNAVIWAGVFASSGRKPPLSGCRSVLEIPDG